MGTGGARAHPAPTRRPPRTRPDPPLFPPTPRSSVAGRVPPASPSSHSIAAAAPAERARLARGTSVRSTFHGGQLRERRAPAGANGPPSSAAAAATTTPPLAPEASPLPPSRSRATANLFSKLTSKLTRR